MTVTEHHDPRAASAAVEAVVRESYGRLVAYLASITHDIAEAEDALSEALAAALRSWPRRGVPDRPDSWLVSVARRNIIGAARHREVVARALPQLDRLRRDDTYDPTGAAESGGADRGPGTADATIPDLRLQLLFACAHPAIDDSMRSPLMLQAVFGLDAARIAATFLVPPATMGQRLVRAKTKIKQAGIAFAIPAAADLPVRLRAVLDAVYAAYGSGWDDPSGADPKRIGLTAEAIRLARLIATSLPEQPEAHGLLALLLHSDARSAARRRADGGFVPLDEQDMSRWSAPAMLEAEHHLSTALRLGAPGPYQLQAAIQSVHNRRVVTGRTDWAAVAALYDGLARFEPTIGTLVARAAARSEADGPESGLRLLDELPPDRVERYQPYHAVRTHCLHRLGHLDEARHHLGRAIELTDDPDVAAHLRRRFATLGEFLPG